MEYIKKNSLQILKSLYFLILFFKILECFTPFGHGDALSYHLVWPKLTLESGFYNMTQEFFSFFLTGYFEIIYFIPNFIFQNTVYAQILGQLIHFSLSLGLGSYLFLRFFNFTHLAYLAGISVLTLNKSSDMFLYAKNDGAMALLVFYTYLCIFHSEKTFLSKSKRKPLWIGLFLGLIPGLKLTGLLFVIPLSLGYTYLERKNTKAVIQAATIAILVLLPGIILKNHFLGSPFYPGLLSMFPGNLPEQVVNSFNAMMAAPISSRSLFTNIKYFFTGKALMLLLIPLFIYGAKKKSLNLLHAGLISMIGFSLYCILNGGITSPRFYFASFFLNLFAVFYFLQNSKLQRFLIPIFILILVDSKIDKSIKRGIENVNRWVKTESSLAILNEVAPLTKIWNHIETEGRKRTWILSDHFPQMYHAPKGVRSDHIPTSPRGIKFYKCKNLSQLNNYDYFFFTHKHNSNPCYKEIINSKVLVATVMNVRIYKNN